jgi:hypothetical protein
MADLQDGHPHAWQREQITLRFLEHVHGKDRGAR